jgi:hypothetical protein
VITQRTKYDKNYTIREYKEFVDGKLIILTRYNKNGLITLVQFEDKTWNKGYYNKHGLVSTFKDSEGWFSKYTYHKSNLQQKKYINSKGVIKIQDKHGRITYQRFISGEWYKAKYDDVLNLVHCSWSNMMPETRPCTPVENHLISAMLNDV